MTVEIRQAGSEWLVEVKGEPIGVAESMAEAERARSLLASSP